MERIVKEQPLKFDMCQFFANGDAFKFLSGLHISQIIDNAELIELEKGDELNIKDDRYAYYVLHNKPVVTLSNGNESTFMEHELISNLFANNELLIDHMIAKEEVKLFKINLNDIFDVLTNYKTLSNRLINTASKNLQNHFYQYSKQ